MNCLLSTREKSEARFRSYFDLPLHGIAITSPEKGWIEVNDRLCSITGYSRDEIVCMTWSEMTHPDDLAADLEQFNRVLSGQIEQYNMDKRFIRKGGEIVWTNLSVGCVRKSDGRVDHIIAVVADITERKRAEEALQEREAKYRSIFKNAVEGIFQTSMDGRFISANPALARIFGYDSPEDMMSSVTNIGRQLYVNREQREAHLRLLDEKGVIENYEARMYRKEGSVVWVSINTRIVRDDAGNPLYYEGFVTDITERKKAEDELKCYAKELEDANTALRVFMGRRDHDQKMLEEKLQLNIGELVVPYLKKLNETNLDSRQKNCLGLLESNLNNIVSPYMLNLSATYKNLTPQQIQIANLIRQGKNTKDIAELLCVSVHTIGTHRNNIRKKLKLRNSKVNLRSRLLSLL